MRNCTHHVWFMLLAGVVAVYGCGDDSGSGALPTASNDTEVSHTPDAAMADTETIEEDIISDVSVDLPLDEPDVARLIEARPEGSFEARNADVIACLEASLEQTIATGAVVGFMEDGEVVWTTGLGVKGVETDEAVETTTLFRFGSVLKMMTATAVLSHVDEGNIMLDADIRDTVPELAFANLPENGLTAHLALSHQGGMVDELEFQGPTMDEGLRAYLLSEAFLDIEFHVPPGTFYNYSNPNFYVSGLLVEAASGSYYREQMSTRVFDPLGMTKTLFTPEEVYAHGDFAWGTRENFLGQINEVLPENRENAWARPAGLGWTSIDDLLRFAHFLMYGNTDVLSDASWSLLRQGHVLTKNLGDMQSYGYGVVRQEGMFAGANVLRDALALIHDGSTLDFTSLMYTLPETGFAMVLMVNGPMGPVSDCAVTALVREAERYPLRDIPEDLLPDPTTFEEYVGEYEETTNMETLGSYRIELSNAGELQITIPLLDAQMFNYTKTLVPTSRDNFVLVTSNGSVGLTGMRNEAGELTYIRTRISVGRKVPEGSSKRSARASANPAHRVWELLGFERPLERLGRRLRGSW